MIEQNILHIRIRSSVHHSICPLPLSISLHVVIAPSVPQKELIWGQSMHGTVHHASVSAQFRFLA